MTIIDINLTPRKFGPNSRFIKLCKVVRDKGKIIKKYRVMGNTTNYPSYFRARIKFNNSDYWMRK